MSSTSETSEQLHPERCLSLTVSGPWGHFRRVEGNVVKQTYRVIPRTTVAGLLAAVLGISRDEYYDLFGPEQSWIAIEPVEPLRTVNMPMNTLSTADGDLTSLTFPRAFSDVRSPSAVESVFMGMLTVRSSETGSIAIQDRSGPNRS